VSDPEVPEREPTEEEAKRPASSYLNDWNDLGVIDAGNDPDSLRTNGMPMFLRTKGAATLR
jgi:hypothetical protein